MADNKTGNAPVELKSKTQKEKLQEITDRLEKGVKDLFASDEYRNFLSVMSKFHNYSFRNTILILLQKPDASMIAGYGAWQKNFKRQVKKGEKGIKIIAPSPYKIQKEQERVTADGKTVTEKFDVTIPAYRVTTVFDVSQTAGEPLPSLGVDKLYGNIDNFNDFYAALEKISPVPIEYENIESNANGYFSANEQRIAVQENMSELQTLKTLVHEIAHAKLHNITPDAIKDLPPEEHKDRQTKEVEAESIAYTVCQHYGIDTSDYTFGYVAGWSSGKELPELNTSLATIQKTANEIILGIDEHFKELAKTKEQLISNEPETDKFTLLSDAEAAEAEKIFEPTEETKITPTVEELENKVKAGEPISLMDLAKAVKQEPKKGKSNKSVKLNSEEKKIKQAVIDVLKEQISHSNDGILSTYKASEQSKKTLRQFKVKIDKNTITKDGIPIFSINRRYSSHKTKGCYRELNPTLEYINAVKQEKPSIRKQLAENKLKSEKTKSTPKKTKEDLSL